MAGLGLTQALGSYQQGLAWHDQQQQLQKQKQAQARMEAANQAAAGVLEKSRGEWAANGAQGNYSPSDATMLTAAEARGAHFAQGGDWENYLRNEVGVQQQRTRVRGQAMQQYDMNGDPIALMQAVYPTIFNGRAIARASKVDKDGQPAIEYELDDGTKSTVGVQDLVGRVKSSLVDPQRTAEMEIQANLARQKIEAQQGKEIAVVEARGGQSRQTEGAKHDYKMTGLGTKFGYDQKLQGARLDAQKTIADDRNDTTLKATDKRVQGSLGAASTRAAGSLATAKVRSAGGGSGAKGSATSLQRTFVGDDGYMYGVPRGGGEAIKITNEGRPVRASEWGKRVDGETTNRGKSGDGLGKTRDQLRKESEKALGGRPGLADFMKKPPPEEKPQGLGTLPALSTFKR